MTKKDYKMLASKVTRKFKKAIPGAPKKQSKSPGKETNGI